MESAMMCHICERPSETRPYGKGGRPICFGCMTSPEREAEAEGQLGALDGLAEAADPHGMVILTDEAPPVSASGVLGEDGVVELLKLLRNHQ